MPSKILFSLSLIAMAVAIGAVGNADYRDAQEQHRYQCNMIEAGHWPAEVNPNCETEVADGR